MRKYFYTQGTIKHGPFTLDELREKGITATTLIWYDGLKQWTAASELDDMAGLLFSTPPPVPDAIANPQTVGERRRAEERERPPQRPKNWLVESILVTLLCCMPFGIAGIVYAAKVDSMYNNEDYRGAQFASEDAKKWTMVSFWLGLGIYVISFLFTILGAGL